jgi:hypothetical protein
MLVTFTLSLQMHARDTSQVPDGDPARLTSHTHTRGHRQTNRLRLNSKCAGALGKTELHGRHSGPGQHRGHRPKPPIQWQQPELQSYRQPCDHSTSMKRTDRTRRTVPALHAYGRSRSAAGFRSCPSTNASADLEWLQTHGNAAAGMPVRAPDTGWPELRFPGYWRHCL